MRYLYRNALADSDLGNAPSSLDSSEAKYDSGTGWPAFKEAHGTWERDESHASIIRRPDNSLGNAGTEVLCKNVSGFLSAGAKVQFAQYISGCSFYKAVKLDSSMHLIISLHSEFH